MRLSIFAITIPPRSPEICIENFSVLWGFYILIFSRGGDWLEYGWGARQSPILGIFIIIARIGDCRQHFGDYFCSEIVHIFKENYTSFNPIRTGLFESVRLFWEGGVFYPVLKFHPESQGISSFHPIFWLHNNCDVTYINKILFSETMQIYQLIWLITRTKGPSTCTFYLKLLSKCSLSVFLPLNCNTRQLVSFLIRKLPVS